MPTIPGKLELPDVILSQCNEPPEPSQHRAKSAPRSARNARRCVPREVADESLTIQGKQKDHNGRFHTILLSDGAAAATRRPHKKNLNTPENYLLKKSQAGSFAMYPPPPCSKPRARPQRAPREHAP